MDGEPEDDANAVAEHVDVNDIEAMTRLFFGELGALNLHDDPDDDILENFFTNAEKENEFCKLICSSEMNTAMSLWHTHGMHDDAKMLLAKLTEMLDATPE